MRILAEPNSLLRLVRAFSLRAVRIRLQLSAARARAMASPMPRVAPVISAVWERSRGGDGLKALLEVGFVKAEGGRCRQASIVQQCGRWAERETKTATKAKATDNSVRPTELLRAVGALAD